MEGPPDQFGRAARLADAAMMHLEAVRLARMQALALLTITTAGSLLPRPPLAHVLSPVPELAYVLQLTGVGTAVGSAIALRAKRRDPRADTWAITTAWATLGLAAGLASLLIRSI